MVAKRTLLIVWVASTVLLAVVIGSCLNGGSIQAAQAPISWGESQAGSENRARELALSGSRLIPAVVYPTSDGHIHEIALKGTWQHRDLTVAAGAPAADSMSWVYLMAYRRSDGISMIVYRGAANHHIYALYLEFVYQGGSWQEVWQCADLSAITGSPAAASDPYGYVRSDGISTVVYVGSDGHIHDLRLEGSWIWADLTAISGAPTAYTNTVGSSIPVAYVRGDGINTVVYLAASDNHIYELRLENGWQCADLTALSSAPPPRLRLAAYVRSDGISTINYTGSDLHVHDIRLDNGWQWADLTSLAGAPTASPTRAFGYVRGDGVNAVVYTTWDDDIYELRLDNGWQSYDLTSVGAGWGYNPVGYVRADGISAVVFKGTDTGHIQEIRLERDGWHWEDLTDLAGAPLPSTHGYPWPYNRSAVIYTYLPLVLRNG